MNFKNNLLLLIVSITIFLFILYFYFIYDKKNYIVDRESGGRISHDDDYWYYDGEWTCVNFVNVGEACDINKGVCAGTHRAGTHRVINTTNNLEEQKLLVKEAGRNKNKIHNKSYIHDLCPIIY